MSESLLRTCSVSRAFASGSETIHVLRDLDFDLAAKKHIEVEADYSDPGIWFNGFAQLPSEGTTVSAETGRVRLGMAGKRRYAVYLHNQGGRDATVKLRFLAYGQVVHEASLDYTPGQ